MSKKSNLPPSVRRNPYSSSLSNPLFKQKIIRNKKKQSNKKDIKDEYLE